MHKNEEPKEHTDWSAFYPKPSALKAWAEPKLQEAISDLICSNCPILDQCTKRDPEDLFPLCTDLFGTVDKILELFNHKGVEG